MSEVTQDAITARQFSKPWEGYRSSPHHAKGIDLDEFARLVSGHANAHVLDIGCGTGHLTNRVSPHVGRVVALDLSPELLQRVATEATSSGLLNVETQAGTVNDLPFEAETFDFVFSRLAARHWLSLSQALCEIRRVLRPGGVAAFTDTVSPGRPVLDTFQQVIEILRDCSHVRDYSMGEWDTSARCAGLRPTLMIPMRWEIEFGPWVERISTPPECIAAIRGLQTRVSDEVRQYFALKADGSFTIDLVYLEASAI